MGDADSHYHLGEQYFGGLGVDESIGMGIRSMTNAANLGQTLAQYILGAIYEGESPAEVEKNLPLSAAWYAVADSFEYPDADKVAARVISQLTEAERDQSAETYDILRDTVRMVMTTMEERQ
jgi:TPR repeat protein